MSLSIGRINVDTYVDESRHILRAGFLSFIQRQLIQKFNSELVNI